MSESNSLPSSNPSLNPSSTSIPHSFVIIIGAGAAGIIQAAEILRAKALPAKEIVILERSENFGGVWLTNKYPGCACDTPIRTFEVSWKRNPNWSNVYAPQPEILAYWHSIANEYGLSEITSFKTEVVKAEWVEPEMHWRVTTRNGNSGEVAVRTCDMLVSATGIFNNPEVPVIPGFSGFKGRHVFPGQWPPGLEDELAGKNVAVVGTGPSAVQIIPEIAEKVGSLAVYQRSPGHVLPRGDNRCWEFTKKMFRMFPGLLWMYGKWSIFIFEIMVKMVCKLPTFATRMAGKSARKYALENITDTKKADLLIPKNKFGFRRPMFSDTYYKVMSSPSVSLHTTPITSIISDSILTSTSTTPVDVIIWATGYDLSYPPYPIFGRNSIPLSTSSGPQYLTLYGNAYWNLPNYGQLMGPHLGSFWIPPLEMYQCVSRYHLEIIAVVKRWKSEKGEVRKALMPRREREEEWVESLKAGRKEVPSNDDGCGTYYKLPDDTLAIYPYSRASMKKMFSRVNFEQDWEVLSTRKDGDGGAVVEVAGYWGHERKEGVFRLFGGVAKPHRSTMKACDEERWRGHKVAVTEEATAV